MRRNKLFAIIGTSILISLSGPALADQIAGTVIRATSSVLFLDDSQQSAVHSTPSTRFHEGVTLTGLVGNQVVVTYHNDGNRKIADAISITGE